METAWQRAGQFPYSDHAIMAYIDQDDIEAIFGEENVVTWSNLDGSTDTADTAAIATAIAWAEAYVEARFRPCGIYTIPFSPATDPVLVNWCATLAGVWLFQRRPNAGGDPAASWADKKTEVEREMDLFITGSRRLTCARAGSRNPTAPFVHRG